MLYKQRHVAGVPLPLCTAINRSPYARICNPLFLPLSQQQQQQQPNRDLCKACMQAVQRQVPIMRHYGAGPQATCLPTAKRSKCTSKPHCCSALLARFEIQTSAHLSQSAVIPVLQSLTHARKLQPDKVEMHMQYAGFAIFVLPDKHHCCCKQ